MVNISIQYTGGLHCDAIHEPSKARIETDAPADNQGKGTAFSPTDLVATALGTCVATTMAIVAERHEVELKGMTVKVAKEMASDPRRISRLTTEVHVPLPADHPQRALLEQTAIGCPVHRSLAAEMARPTQFFWEG
ncbi:MAG: OsmC family protein [Chthoniobacterales bacterium]|nr:OsmC family protein [Chthoniobacterales bacterium]